MKIQIAPHTLQRAKERGATEAEIIEVLETGTNILSKYGRFGKSKVFAFDNIRTGKYYDEKKLEVSCIIEPNLHNSNSVCFLRKILNNDY